MLGRLALGKGTLYAALGAAALIGVLVGVIAIQNARLSLAELERDTAQQMYERSTTQLQEARDQLSRTETALHQRHEKLQASMRQTQQLRNRLQQLSREIDNEKWQACRTVRTPDALLYGVRAPGDEN